MPLSLTLALLLLFMVFRCSSYLKCRFSTGDVKSSITASNSHSTSLRSSSLTNLAAGKVSFQLWCGQTWRMDDVKTPPCSKVWVAVVVLVYYQNRNLPWCLSFGDFMIPVCLRRTSTVQFKYASLSVKSRCVPHLWRSWTNPAASGLALYKRALLCGAAPGWEGCVTEPKSVFVNSSVFILRWDTKFFTHSVWTI